MPLKDGFQATQEIRDIERQNPRKSGDVGSIVPIVALTGEF
jgi:hypothetical protein